MTAADPGPGSAPRIDVERLRSGDRRTLARAITLIESQQPAHAAAAAELLDAVQADTGNSIRIGISGTPGVGKSTFIESFGLRLVEAGHRIAVLAVDPSSPIGGGSILGDKTRMEQLARAESAFIRPSPSAGSSGGVAQRTRETLLLCEAAGYDVVVVETVGVGQSEYDVAAMVDFFLVLLQPHAGDELQGIKRGILELADALVINKADGENRAAAERARQHYHDALAIAGGGGDWTVPVMTCSAIEGAGLAELWQLIERYRQESPERLAARRARQNVHWMEQLLAERVRRSLREHGAVNRRRKALEDEVLTGRISARAAADELFRLLIDSQR